MSSLSNIIVNPGHSYREALSIVIHAHPSITVVMERLTDGIRAVYLYEDTHAIT